MLAVLPFENLTGDTAQEYSSDGLTEEMISQLGSLNPEQLGVIARTSVMHYKNSQTPLEQIGRELGVQYVLEGSVRRDSNKVRISAQLIQMKDQTHLWSRQYDRELSSLLVLQGEIAREIAGEIQLTLGDDRKRIATDRKPVASSTSYEAYDLYLKGRYFWNKRTGEGFQEAAEYFQQAIDKDPNYARAYAGLADTFALMSTWYLAPPNEIMPKARAAALKALEIDDSLAEAHTSLALITENYDWDWRTAEKEYQRAIQLDPGYATAHQWYAEFLSFQGRFDEALAESERARRLDPLSLIIATDHGAILYFSRQYDRAIEQFRAVLEMEPGFGRANMIIYAYVQKGEFAEALAYIEKTRRLYKNDQPRSWRLEAYVYGHSGQLAQAQKALEKLKQLDQRWQIDIDPSLYVALNRKDEAIALLQRACSEHSSVVTSLKVEPNYDPLRSDPRFQELQRRVGLAQ
jgi:TolB-like protein/Tfp pilus assembly protein PilF